MDKPEVLLFKLIINRLKSMGRVGVTSDFKSVTGFIYDELAPRPKHVLSHAFYI
jgi:hypothetical protein